MFYQDHLPTPPVETPLVFLLVSFWTLTFQAYVKVSIVYPNLTNLIRPICTRVNALRPRYPLGIIAVLMNRFIYRYAFGMLIPPFPFYPFPLRYSLSLPIPRLPDPFPSFPQPLTLRNRLPINIPAGSLLSTPLAVALKGGSQC